jgi:predicted secreted protein
MADSDKNIRITTSKNKTTFPKIVFTGSSAGSSVITLEVLDDNTVSFTSNEGQVFSLDSNLSTGTIWSVNDVSGFPLLRADVGAASGATIRISEGLGFVGIGQTNPLYKLDVKGQVGFASTNDNSYSILIDNVSAAGSNSLQIRAQNDLRFFNSGNTFYTGFQAGAPSANTTYTLPIAFPGTAGSVLVSDLSGVMSWALAATGTVTTLTAGAGISFGGSTITTTGTIRRKTHYNLTFMSGYTPTASGVDTVVLRVPDSAADAGTNIYNCREVMLRVETPSAGTSTINVQKYAGAGTTAFSTTSTGSTTNILSAALSITGATVYEASSSTFAAGHGTVAGGDKLRINFTALNATHVAFNISLLLEEQ